MIYIFVADRSILNSSEGKAAFNKCLQQHNLIIVMLYVNIHDYRKQSIQMYGKFVLYSKGGKKMISG
jgi:hypothetical protein